MKPFIEPELMPVVDDAVTNLDDHDRFHTFRAPYAGMLADDGEGVRIYGYNDLPEEGLLFTHAVYGVVLSGSVHMRRDGSTHQLVPEGCVFTAAPHTTLFDIAGGLDLVVFTVADYTPFDSVIRIEPRGRLKYINGCHDTILSGPIAFGDPVLNALYMPTGVNQTMHTHPSTRAGVVLHSEGAYSETPVSKHSLSKGTVFYLPKNGRHKFRTDEADTTLALVAFHPDSDFGPTDEVHPMINRTIVDVDGEKVSASVLDDVRTTTDAADVL